MARSCQVRRLTAAQKQLVAKYLPLASNVSRPWRRLLPQHEDTIHDGAIDGLIEAARKHRSDRNVRFATYAAWLMRLRIRDRLRRVQLLGYRNGVEVAPQLHEIERARLVGECSRVLRQLEEDGHNHLLSLVPPRHAVVLRLLVEDERGVRAVARRYHLSRERAEEKVVFALERLAYAMQARVESG
jgi:RNA polymerase sigma factor (sigma-70 family)